MTDAIKAAARSMSEDALQACIIGSKGRPGLATSLGYLVAHFRAAKILRADGGIQHLTPVSGNGKGFPDLVMVSETRQRIVFAELKSEHGPIRPEQKVWLKMLGTIADLLNAAAGRCWVLVVLWRPSDWLSGAIERALLGKEDKNPAGPCPSCGGKGFIN